MRVVRFSSFSASGSASRSRADGYVPPSPLADLHVLDLLELAGSQARAGAALALHQSTVCRSLRLMKQQFRLVPDPAPVVCRHGHNPCLQHLRLAYREHRLMAGLLRISADPLHHQFLRGLASVQPVPPRFRSGDHWAELVRRALLDGAIISSFALPKLLPSGQVPRWDGLRALSLGHLGLALVAPSSHCRRVLLPQRQAAPLLHQAIVRHGFDVEAQPTASQEPAAWLKRAHDRNLALPICPGLVGSDWLQANGLTALDDQPPLIEQLWLLLPQAVTAGQAVRLSSRRLRLRIARAAAGIG